MSQFNGIEFSLRRRDDTKNWFMDFYLRGRRLRVSLKTSDKNLAMLKARAMLSRYVEHQLPTTSLSVKEFERRYLEHVGARLRPRTVTAHKAALQHFFTFRDFSNLSAITPRDVDEFMTYLLNRSGKGVKPMAPVSVNTTVRMLRQIFNQAVRWEVVVSNPFNMVRLLKFQQPEVRVLGVEEIAEILAGADEHYPQYADLFRFYLLTGMRLSEPLNMTWKNVHWREEYIELTWTKGKYNRKIPLLPATRRILERRKDFDRPFPHDSSKVIKAIRDICTIRKIEPATVQNLRSSTYSYMVKIGIPQPLIRKIIGHTGDTIGQIHYFNMSPKDVIAQTKGLEQLVGKP